MLDGAARIADVVATAAADGQPAVGITDHGNMYGVLDFYKAARADVKPVIGMEAYFVTTSAYDRPKRAEHEIFHLTLLAETERRATATSSRCRRPRVPRRLLLQAAHRLRAARATPRGPHRDDRVPRRSRVAAAAARRRHAAREAAARFQDIFGRDTFFVELQDHGPARAANVNPQLLDIARELRAPLLATNDSHYTTKEDAEAHARCCACRPAPRSTTRTGSSSTATSST